MYFYDFNLKLNHQINDNNRLFVSGYLGRDNFGQKGTSSIGFGNKTFTLRWNHVYSNQLFSNITAVAANYNYSLFMKQASSKAFWNSSLLDYTLKADFNYYPNSENEIKFGASSTFHDINPCKAWMQGENDSSESIFSFQKITSSNMNIYLESAKNRNKTYIKIWNKVFCISEYGKNIDL